MARFTLPRDLYWGKGSLENLKTLQGKKAVLVLGGGSMKRFGFVDKAVAYLKEAGIEIREMNSGCICCSLVGDFGEALKEVIEKYHPDRIIIEPSGVGKLSDVTKAVQKVEDAVDIKLNSFTTIVDVTKCKMYMKNFGEFFSNQIEYAGTIILSRTDTEKATEEKIVTAVEIIRSLNKKAAVITTPVEKLAGEKILDIMENNRSLEKELMEEEACPVCGGHHHEHEHHHHDHEECGCGHDHHHEHEHHHHDHEECGCGHDHHHEHEHHHHHHADEVFTSWGKETVKIYSQDEIKSILDTLSNDESYGMILRAKGMVEGKDGQWIYFDMVPGEADIREGSADYTGRICVIGSKIQEDKLSELFGI